jgi:hypothetical protein
MSTATVKVKGELVDDKPTTYPNEIDVFDESNRPNGTQLQAVIAPKLPKASGELKDEIKDGRFVQRQVTEDDAVATQGGGKETKKGETPGPKVEGEEKGIGGTTAAGKREDEDQGKNPPLPKDKENKDK